MSTGRPLDDVPLWAYIDPSLVGVGAGGTIPNSCVRSTFANGSNPDFDWDGDGTLDRPGSFQHMSSCLLAHAAANGPVLFLETLKESPRFSYVPQFWESTFPNGNGWRHILRFKATWLQATWWKKGATTSRCSTRVKLGPSPRWQLEPGAAERSLDSRRCPTPRSPGYTGTKRGPGSLHPRALPLGARALPNRLEQDHGGRDRSIERIRRCPTAAM